MYRNLAHKWPIARSGSKENPKEKCRAMYDSELTALHVSNYSRYQQWPSIDCRWTRSYGL